MVRVVVAGLGWIRAEVPGYFVPVPVPSTAGIEDVAAGWFQHVVVAPSRLSFEGSCTFMCFRRCRNQKPHAVRSGIGTEAAHDPAIQQ
jgi:hypothetical protein